MPHWCPNKCRSTVTLLTAPPGEDRWFAVLDGGPEEPHLEREFLDAMPMKEIELDVGVTERAIAAFGMDWAAITNQVAWAMLMMLEAAPSDFGAEFMRWEPEQLRWMREHTVAGGHASFFEAVRCLGRYRRAASLDIRPPLQAGD